MPKLRVEHFFLSLVAVLVGVGVLIFSGAVINQANVVSSSQQAYLATIGNGKSINDVLLSFRMHESEMHNLLNIASDFRSSRQVRDYIDAVDSLYDILLDHVQGLYNAPLEVVLEMREHIANIDEMRDQVVDFIKDDNFSFSDELIRDLNRMNQHADSKSLSIQELLLYLNPLAFQTNVFDKINISYEPFGIVKESRLLEANDPVNFVLVNNIMALKTDGQFHENDFVSKGELVSALALALRINPVDGGAATYDDVPLLWAPVVNTATQNGWVSPESLYTFGFNDYVTRAQGVFAVLQAYGLPTFPAERPQTFVDVMPELNFIEFARQIGLVNGATGNLFAPDRLLTRYELASMLMKASSLSII